MNQYTLDYSSPQPQRWQRAQRPNRRMKRAFRQVLPLLCGLACSIALIGTLRMRSDMSFHRQRYQAQAIQYDSLLAAKLDVDRQLEYLRTQLRNR
jgi:hypothetical protein